MLKSYLTLAIRNLKKQKAFAFINVAGLAVGIACFSLLILFVTNEWSFDRFNSNANRIYRLYAQWDPSLVSDDPNTVYTEYGNLAGEPLGEAMKKDLPDVEQTAQWQLPWGDNLVRSGNQTLRAAVGFADGTLFNLFDFPLKYGTKASALGKLNDIVLTENRAKQLFGKNDNGIGRVIEIKMGPNWYPFTISGVAYDPPPNSTIRFDVLANMQFYRKMGEHAFDIGRNWHPTVNQTFVLLRPGSKLPNRPDLLDRLVRKYSPMDNFGDLARTWKKAEYPVAIHLQPLLSIHTDSWFHGYAFTDYQKIDPATLWILLAIAAGILVIACINFTTLAIGRSAARSREVGLRKVVGAERRQIVAQFLTESVVLSLLSAALGQSLAFLALPWFNQLAGRDLHFSFRAFPPEGLLIAIVTLIAGMLAGSYPAFVLSRFKAVDVFRAKVRLSGSNLFTRSLVTFQFVISMVLIVCTIVILQQATYMINKNPGFDKENVLVIDAAQTDPGKLFPLFKQSLQIQPEILGVTSAAAGMGAGKNLLSYRDRGFAADINVIDTAYLRVMGMRLLAGGNLDPTLFGDSIKSMLINETTMLSRGWNLQNVIGKRIVPFQGGIGVITGVVQNFHYRPFGEAVRNQAFIGTADKGYVNFYIRLRSGNPAHVLAEISRTWHKLAPDVPLQYSFLNEDINNFYQSEGNWSRIVAWAGGISIFLACLGLLGLTSLAATNRTKEIGIRKVLGASETNIVLLVAKGFIQLVALAFLIATPVAWLLMHRWLTDYADRIGISWVIFAAVGVCTALLAMAAIGQQALRAALVNPVKALRSE
jgi:putative ABC transport system permease protein